MIRSLHFCLQEPDDAEAGPDAALLVEGHAVTPEVTPEAPAEPAAEAGAEAEEDEAAAPTGGLELAEAAEKLLAELEAYSKWKVSVRIHKLPAEAAQSIQPATGSAPEYSQVHFGPLNTSFIFSFKLSLSQMWLAWIRKSALACCLTLMPCRSRTSQ